MLERHSLQKGRLLDGACGSGKAFEPMLTRGWEIVGCDLSPKMLDQARGKASDAISLHVGDLRELPTYGEFDLVWALNGAVNCLLEDGDLERALAGLRANLAPGGRILIDTDTLGFFERNYAIGCEGQMAGSGFFWVGATENVEPGCVGDSQITGSDMEPQVYRSRHHPEAQIEKAMETAGLDLLATVGQQDDSHRVAEGRAGE